MAEAVHGDPSIDDLGKDVVKAINKLLAKKSNMKNLSGKISRDLGRASGHLNTECIFWSDVKISQSVGGVKSTRPTSKRS